MWPFKTKQQPIAEAVEKASMGAFSPDARLGVPAPRQNEADGMARLVNEIKRWPQPAAMAQDGGAESDEAGIGEPYPIKTPLGFVSPALFEWYASQTFIGYQFCAVIAQQWLVDKACSMPAKDATRQGYEVDVEAHDPDEVTDEDAQQKLAQKAITMIKDLDDEMRIKDTMREFIHFGRIYGIRVAMYIVESTDPEYYKKPFNIDGIKPGTYKGISQIDPQWCVPVLTGANLNDPSGLRFYQPTFYNVGGREIHHSHLCIYIPYPVTDFLRPGYQFGGISVPQRIYERVYASERTANEAPILAMTKRLIALALPDSAFADENSLFHRIAQWTKLKDNHGVRVGGKDEMIQQFDTSLADLDSVIMTQYQLVAAIAEVPSTKLLGTSPKGFGASGEYEEASYREFLEGIQGFLTPMLRMHHALLMRSEVAPRLECEPMRVTVQWASLDSPTALEWADIELKKAQTDQIYYTIQAIDGQDIRDKIRNDNESSYFGLADVEDGEEVEVESGTVDPDAEVEEPDSEQEAQAAAEEVVEGEPIAAVSLNGAQITSLVAVLKDVALGGLPESTAREIISTSFPIDDATVERMLIPMREAKPVDPAEQSGAL